MAFASERGPGPRKAASIASAPQAKNDAPPWHIRQLSVGSYHSVALTNYGHVYVWGHQGSDSKAESKEQQTAVWTPQRVNVERVDFIATGYEHTLVVTKTGRLFAWGRGEEGQLGTGRLTKTFTPTPVVGFTQSSKVIRCAAGDRHSAAIVRAGQSNSLYTWGCSESGKLGLSNEVVSGQKASAQKVPARWQDAQGGEPVLVACGENHTGVIIAKPQQQRAGAEPSGDVWMFGGGWYGRLGLGRNDNEYVPQLVTETNMFALACGAFHSCSISSDKELWVWGRDKCVCELKHVDRPKKFTHLESVTKVVQVICGAVHTIVMSEGPTGGHDLWVWGDNTSSQLGLGENASDNVFVPLQMRLLPGQAKPGLVATSQYHSMAMITNEELYAWGNQSCGRLGLEQRPKAKYVRTPAKVAAGWASIETMCELTQDSRNPEVDGDYDPELDEIFEDGSEYEDQEGKLNQSHLDRMLLCMKAGQKLENFATVQIVLKSEQEAAKLEKLKEKEETVEIGLRSCLATILELPEKEKQLRRLESCLQQSIGSNMRFFPVGQAELKVNGSIKPKLKYFAELLWTLKMQPIYMSVLSVCIEGDTDAEEKFYKVVSHLYADLRDRWTMHLLMAMMKLMASKEIEGAKELNAVFTAGSSRLLHCFSYFVQQGMLWATQRSTKEEPRVITNADGRRLVSCNILDEKGNALLNPADLGSALLKVLAYRSDRIYITRAEFDQAQRQEGRHGDTTAAYMSALDRFKEFMAHFRSIISQFQLEPPLRMIMSHVLEEVRARQFAQEKMDGVSGEAVLCLPLLQLYVKGILSPMLKNVENYAEKILSKEMQILMDEHQHNLHQVIDFCEVLAKVHSGSKEKVIESIAAGIRADILKYLLEQAGMHDNTDTELLVDMYTAHFDREPHVVAMPTATLMDLSNMLSANMQRLRLKEDDPIFHLCAAIGVWDEKVIEAVRGNVDGEAEEQVHNFTMNTRFLFEHKAFTICPLSSSPVPPRLSAKADQIMVLKRYAANTKLKAKHFELMKILAALDEPLSQRTRTMQDLKEAMEAMKKTALSKANRNIELAKTLRNGVEVVAALQSLEASEANLFQFISHSVLERDRHRLYLQAVDDGLQEITKVQDKHTIELQKAEIELQRALESSLSLSLPKRLTDVVDSMPIPVRLGFQRISTRVEARHEFKRNNQPTFAFAPTATYSLDWLIKKEVVVKREGIFKDGNKRKVRLIFTYLTDRSVEITCSIIRKRTQRRSARIFNRLFRYGSPHGAYVGRTNENIVAVIKLTEAEIQELHRAGAAEQTTLPKGPEACFTFNSTNLVNLVAQMSVERRKHFLLG